MAFPPNDVRFPIIFCTPEPCGEGQTGEAYHKPDYPGRQTAFPPPRGTKDAMFCDFLMETYATERTKTLALAMNFAAKIGSGRFR
jgi:hypothetical protein